jgi:hypothetical protein
VSTNLIYYYVFEVFILRCTKQRKYQRQTNEIPNNVRRRRRLLIQQQRDPLLNSNNLRQLNNRKSGK